ncbi:Ig-like domain-containing protein, partial [Flavobacterium sp.]|uniref:HYR-like domain-containing protein n=1 Tax=Flavobacterium sp. TaxID=239 RepID=UPI0037C13FF7
MENLYFNSIAKKLRQIIVLLVILFGFSITINAQVLKAFTQRTAAASPTRTIYNVKGDFAMLGNTSLTPQFYSATQNNNNQAMVYVDTDNDANTFNSSSSTLTYASENGSVPSCSTVVFAGLYWTGAGSPDLTFNVTKNNVTKTFNKRIVKLKGPNASSYTDITAAASDIYYPSGTEDNIYSAYAEVTDYVRQNGIGRYTVADMALLEGGQTIGTGFSGGWGMIVIYQNYKMKWRDVTIFDGYAYVAAGNSATGFELPLSGFNTVQSGNVGMKIGFMASEGDVSFYGDFFKIRNLATNNYTTLSRNTNGVVPIPDNFFNSSITAPGIRNPNLVNNTGVDIGIVNIPNANNSIIGNSQTSTSFLYGTSGDTFSIYMFAMSVDASIPEVEGVITVSSINGTPAVQPYTILPGQEAGYSVDIKNIGTEVINNYKLIVPIPYNATYVQGSAEGTIFSPQTTPTPNNISFNPSLGATGSIVWDFGTLVLPANSSSLLARLTFKLLTTTDCSILHNDTCANSIAVVGNSTGIGAITQVVLNNSNLIQGYTQNGSCSGEPIPTPINITINSTNYEIQNCTNTDYTRHFSYCSASNSIGTSQIASNFPVGSLFYDTFPVTVDSIQYTDANPIPLVLGSTITYYAVPSNGGSGCNFPFTITKCPLIIAQDDALVGGNGTIGNPNAGNVLNNNGSGSDTLNNIQATINQVIITVTTPATSIGGNPVPFIDTNTGQVSIPAGTPAGTYTIVYNLCEELNPTTNCDPATLTITVSAPIIVAVNDSFTNINCTTLGIIGNVLSNDTLNGVSFPANLVNFTLLSGSHPNISFSSNGEVNLTPGIAAGVYTFTYKICQVLNPLNCSNIATISITVVDTTAPVISALPGISTISCPATPSFATPTATDTCGTVTLTSNNVITNGDCPNSYSITRTWTATDASGNTATASQTIIVQDSTAPTWITSPNALDTTLQCNDAQGLSLAQALEPVATDNCDTNLEAPIKVDGAFIPSSSCPNSGTITNTWTVKDACDNTSSVFTQVITILDTTPPTWTTNAGSLDRTIQCSDATGLASAQALAPIATDNCSNTDGPSNITYTKTSGAFTAGSCPNNGTYTNTWVAKDVCNNTSTVFTQVITIQDTTPPAWTTAANALNANFQCADAAGLAAAQALAPVATDNCVGTVTYTKTSGAFTAGSCPNNGTYTNTWVAKDVCNNTSTVFTQVITIQDTTPPAWTTAANSLNANFQCADAAGLAAAQALAPVATDNCGGTVTYTKTSGAFTAGSCPNNGTYTNTWVAKDVCNNTSTVFTQVITIQDTTPPAWTTAANALNANFQCADAAGLAAAQALAPVATDNCGGTVTYTKTSGAFTAGSCPNNGTYTNTWVAKDVCTNTSSVFTQVITIQDTTPPAWTTAANALNANFQCADATGLAAAQALAPVATDNCGGTVTYTKTSGAFTAGSCPNNGTYTNTWVAKDVCNNTSSVFTQVITIQDTTPPAWTTAANSLNRTFECSDVTGLA